MHTIQPRALLWLAPLILLFEIAIRPVYEPDLFFYFALIERYLTLGSWPTLDPFLFTLPNDAPMTLHQWFGYWTLYLPYLALGWAGPILLKTVLTIAFFTLPLIPFWFARRLPPTYFVLAWSVALFVAHHRIRERVSLWGDLFALALCAGLLWAHDKKWFWQSLPLGFLLWAQIHPSYPLGFAILLLYGLCEFSLLRKSGYWKYALLCVPATMIHPLFLEGFLYPFTFSWEVEPYLSQHVMEWLPLWDERIFPYTFLYIPLVTFIPWLFIRFFQLPTPRRIFTLVLFGLACALMLKSVRFGMLAQGLFLLLLTDQEQTRPLSVNSLISVLAAALCVLGVGFKVLKSPSLRRPLSQLVSLDPVRLPLEAAETLKKANPQMPIFNSFAYGGYLAWRWQGQPPIFFHGFSTNFKFYEENYLEPMTSAQALEKLIAKYDLGIFLLTKTGYDGDYIELLSQNTGWQLMYEDAGSMIFIKRDPRVFEQK